MSKIIVNSFKEFEAFVGKEIGVSDYFKITQERINQFADATEDHQWIHCDVERAKQESPFHNTIAHGYLTLSLLPHLWDQVIQVNNTKMMVNYGIESLRFGQAVVVDSSIRLKASLESIVNLRGVSKAVIKAVLEIEGEKKPAFDGKLVFLYHFVE